MDLGEWASKEDTVQTMGLEVAGHFKITSFSTP